MVYVLSRIMFSFDSYDTVLRDLVKQRIDKSDHELEIRFAENSKSDLFPAKQPANSKIQPKNWSFRPNVTKTTFTRMMNTFKRYNLQSEVSSSVDTFYKVEEYGQKKEKTGQIWRHSLVNNTTKGTMESLWMTKRKTKPIDIWNVNTRISFSSETVILNANAPHTTPYMIRRKSRTSFFDWCVRYDLTNVVTETYDTDYNLLRKDRSNEVELEFIPIAGGTIDDFVQHLKACAIEILRILQDSPAIITLSEKHNVLLEYSLLTGCLDQPRFIGAQPETLHKRHLPIIKKATMYCISEKYDGERFQLFFSDNGTIYAINRKLKIKSTGLHAGKDKGSTLDAEYVNNMLFAFDVIFNKGEDLRGKVDYLLPKRLDILNDVVSNCYNNNTSNKSCIPLFKKEYTFGDFEGVISAFANNDYDDYIQRDGLIYTPVKEFYPVKPKWSTLLKWKPPEMNSIDFAVKASLMEKDKWNLFVGDKDNSLVQFTPHPSIIVDACFLETLKNNGDDCKDNLGVIECAWNFEEKRFFPVRKRYDKTAPNFVTVALDVWESIMNPVLIEQLYCKSFSNMRKLHNEIKSYVIRRAVELRSVKQLSWADCVDDDEMVDDEIDTLHVLDLACGRGGDLWKWSGHVKGDQRLSYTGVDIDDSLLNEAEKRSQQVKSRNRNTTYLLKDSDVGNLSYKFYQKDLRVEKLQYSGEKFQVVSCQFALHYFYETHDTFYNFLSNVTNYIQEGGIFICTLFDGQQVYDLCRRNENKQTSNESHGFEIQPLYDTTDTLESLRNRDFGIPINAVLIGDDQVILKESTKEYLVFADLFVTRMKTNGFTLLETGAFDSFKNHESSAQLRLQLTEQEKLYSSLHRYYMFRFNAKSLSCWKSYVLDENLSDGLPNSVKKLLESGTLVYKDCSVDPEMRDLCGGKSACLQNSLETVTGISDAKIDPEIDFQKVSNDYKVNLGVVDEGMHYNFYRSQTDQEKMLLLIVTKEHIDVLFSGNSCLFSCEDSIS